MGYIQEYGVKRREVHHMHGQLVAVRIVSLSPLLDLSFTLISSILWAFINRQSPFSSPKLSVPHSQIPHHSTSPPPSASELPTLLQKPLYIRAGLYEDADAFFSLSSFVKCDGVLFTFVAGIG